MLQTGLPISILSATSPQSRTMKQAFLSALLALAALALISCSSPAYGPLDEDTPGASYEKGVPGGTVVETYKLTATVTAIDVPARRVTLTAKDGKRTSVTCGPEVINFDQIRIGDVVKGTLTSELTVAMASADTPSHASETGLVAVAPKGAKPGALMAETQTYTATISAIDLKRRRATLLFPDGTTRTFVVRQDVDLAQRQVGEAVAIRVAVAMALSLEKP